MKTALLDVNVLVALFWPDHEHHSAALQWLRRRRGSRWATCPLTQLAFIRLVSNPAFSREALSPENAARLLAKNLQEVPTHDFWPDELEVTAAVHAFEGGVRGYRQITDAYLLQLTVSNKGVLATFDRGTRELAGEKFAAAIEIIPA